ncbi:hypothetical protein OHA72_36130 [Dactylosporangium sp. NBC_01737]|uniref:hypothetical protein n=1 Tax=Dactylosporangium sp. NBC_01737 TaxID=2975959 RepID=UPI002E15E9A4|nr:hypothetical protein OHA72_36130 [Dactylosporangium sp. NBC_01737]
MTASWAAASRTPRSTTRRSAAIRSASAPPVVLTWSGTRRIRSTADARSPPRVNTEGLSIASKVARTVAPAAATVSNVVQAASAAVAQYHDSGSAGW